MRNTDHYWGKIRILDEAKRKYYRGKIRIFGKNIHPCLERLEVVEGEETEGRLAGVEDYEDMLGLGRDEAGRGQTLFAALQTRVESPELQTGGQAGLHHQLLDD